MDFQLHVGAKEFAKCESPLPLSLLRSTPVDLLLIMGLCATRDGTTCCDPQCRDGPHLCEHRNSTHDSHSLHRLPRRRARTIHRSLRRHPYDWLPRRRRIPPSKSREQRGLDSDAQSRGLWRRRSHQPPPRSRTTPSSPLPHRHARRLISHSKPTSTPPFDPFLFHLYICRVHFCHCPVVTSPHPPRDSQCHGDLLVRCRRRSRVSSF